MATLESQSPHITGHPTLPMAKVAASECKPKIKTHPQKWAPKTNRKLKVTLAEERPSEEGGWCRGIAGEETSSCAKNSFIKF